MSSRMLLALLASLLPMAAGAAQDAIVGTWAGAVAQGDNSFPARITFVSPKGGISRYPSYPCGGTLSGDRKGDGYVYTETITYGGMDEKPDGCIHGTVSVTVDGDTLKYVWTGSYNGENYSAEGELRRVKRP
jgi:hypothetical protein